MGDSNLDFSQVASRYQREAVVQQKAADRLFELLRISGDQDVLDLGCGSGALTRRIRDLTGGRVVGLDAAEGMIHEAKRLYRSAGIEFGIGRAQDLRSIARDPTFTPTIGPQAFDVVFCNSTLHWIKPLGPALDGCKTILRPGGKLGVQAAAMSEYCPNFVRALDKVRSDARTASGYKDFVPPWSFLESEDAYTAVFSQAGFKVPYVAIEDVTSRHTVEEAFGVFSAGAAAGYLNRDNYKNPFDENYYGALLSVVREALSSQADKEGMLNLTFRRVYVVAFA